MSETPSEAPERVRCAIGFELLNSDSWKEMDGHAYEPVSMC